MTNDVVHHRWSRFPIIAASTIIAALFTTTLVAIEWRVQQDREDNRLCERAVEVREDGRAMWEWLIEAVAETSPLAPEARHQLDTLLPSLRCDEDNHPVPIED
jgi:hypothetical protein